MFYVSFRSLYSKGSLAYSHLGHNKITSVFLLRYGITSAFGIMKSIESGSNNYGQIKNLEAEN